MHFNMLAKREGLKRDRPEIRKWTVKIRKTGRFFDYSLYVPLPYFEPPKSTFAQKSNIAHDLSFVMVQFYQIGRPVRRPLLCYGSPVTLHL